MKKQKSVPIIMSTVALLVFIAFGSLFLGAWLQDKKGWSGLPVILMLLIFFGSMLLALTVMILNYKFLIEYELNKKNNKYQVYDFSIINDITKNKVDHVLKQKRFKEERSYFIKKKLTFAKDSITYYIRHIDGFNLSYEIQKEYDRFENKPKKADFACLLLIFYYDYISKDDFDMLRKISINQILSDEVRSRPAISSLVVLVNKQTKQAYYLDVHKKGSISLYAYSCRMLKKYFQ